jgi:hypothetical protein
MAEYGCDHGYHVIHDLAYSSSSSVLQLVFEKGATNDTKHVLTT